MLENKDKFIATWSFLTIFPAAKASQKTSPQLSMMPLVGLSLGFIFYVTAWLLSGFNPAVTGLLILILWLGSTGFLHLDGLADLSDALGAAHGDKTRFLEVLKAPNIGSFAVIVLIVVIASKLVLLSSLSLAEIFAPLLLIPAWARLGAAWWASELPPLHEGLATWLLDAGEINLTPWLISLLILSLLFAPILLLAPVILWGWKLFLQRKVQGMNGDCLGAGIEVCEVLLLILCCLNL